MSRMATLTLNPSIDCSSTAPKIMPTHKIRMSQERFDPGGGGINVARVLQRLGAEVQALYMAGGVTGPVLSGLLTRAGLPHECIEVAGDTRVSMAIHEAQSGSEFRFVPAGPSVTAQECEHCLQQVLALDCDWLVLSGSLPPGMPDDFYAQIASRVAGRGVKIVLDTSGPALKETLRQSSVYAVKPSLGEMEQLAGQALSTQQEIADAAQALVSQGRVQCVAVSLGHRGALMVDAQQQLALPALPVEVRSAVGAGDSFVAAMTWALSKGWNHGRAFRLGLAAGSAAVLTPGTDLCHRSDVARLAAQLGIDRLD